MIRFKKSKFILFAPINPISTVIVLFTFFVFGCGENVEKISEHQVFRYNEDVSVNTLDPVYIKSQSEIWIGSQIYEGLIGLDSTLKPIPQLAKSWEILDSGRVYKFVIRDNISFVKTDINKNGKPQLTLIPLNILDVSHSLYRVLDPKTASPGAWILNDKMQMPSEFLKQGITDYETLARNPNNPIYIQNDSTIILKLLKPFPAFLSLLATNYAWITPRSSSQLGIHPVGTGPFYLRRWETDVKMVLRKNSNYYESVGNMNLPFLESVVISFVKNKQTAFMQFMAGQYDFFNGVEASFIDELLQSDASLNPKYRTNINALIGDFLNTEYLGFYLGDSLNGKPNPFQDLNLRKALQLGIDNQALLKYQRNGLGTPGYFGFVPPVLWTTNNPLNSNHITNYKQQVERAIEFWNKSEFKQNPARFNPLVLTTTADYLDMAVFIQNSWKQLGIPVTIELQTGGMLRQLRNAGKLGMFRGSWIADYPDPENYLACFFSPYKSPNGPNYTHFENQEFDGLFNDIAFADISTQSGYEDREIKARKANNIIQEQAPIVVLYYDKSVRLSQKNIVGLGNDPINRLNLKRVRKIKN